MIASVKWMFCSSVHLSGCPLSGHVSRWPLETMHRGIWWSHNYYRHIDAHITAILLAIPVIFSVAKVLPYICMSILIALFVNLGLIQFSHDCCSGMTQQIARVCRQTWCLPRQDRLVILHSIRIIHFINMRYITLPWLNSVQNVSLYLYIYISNIHKLAL